MFLPIVGFVGDSCCIKAIANRALGLQIDKRCAYHQIIFGEFNKSTEHGLKYVQTIIEKCLANGTIIGRDHHVFNIARQKLNTIDRFLCSLRILIDPYWYMQICNKFLQEFQHHNQIVFHKLPFQQFMLLDKLLMILMRSDVSEYAALILMEMKHSLGVSSMTLTDCHRLIDRFNKKVVTHIIPRRHGKTIFTHFLNALCLVLFPSATLKMLYVAQNKDLTNNAFKCMQNIVLSLCETFNSDQKAAYYMRQELLRNNIEEVGDFYHRVVASFHVHSGIVSCSYHKEGVKTTSSRNQYLSKNQISCVVYREKNVSITSNPIYFQLNVLMQ